MKKVYVPFRYVHIIQHIFTKNNKQTIKIKHLFRKIFVQVAQKAKFFKRKGKTVFFFFFLFTVEKLFKIV